MKKLQKISFHLHWITMCFFLLPFFYDGCSTKKTDEAVEDSTAVVVPVDTLAETTSKNCAYPPSACITSDRAMISQDVTPSSTENKNPVETLIDKYPIMMPVLMPASGVQTGLAGIIIVLEMIPVFATTITLLLLILCLLAKLIDRNGLKIFLTLEIAAILFLAIAIPMLLQYETLWGYWLCFVFLSTLILLDTYIIFKQQKNIS